MSKPLLTQDHSHLAAPSLQGPTLLALGTEAGAALGRASVSPSEQWGALEARETGWAEASSAVRPPGGPRCASGEAEGLRWGRGLGEVP